jgi:hypothetical protein
MDGDGYRGKDTRPHTEMGRDRIVLEWLGMGPEWVCTG